MNEIEVFIDVPAIGGDVPSGGTAGQVLTKRSDESGDYGWENVPTPTGVEMTENKVQQIGPESTETQYPSAKAVYDYAQEKEDGKGLSEENFTNEEKTKLNLLPTAQQLAESLNNKQGKLTFDDVPTENSENPVKSGGVFSALAGKASASDLEAYDKIIGIPNALPVFNPEIKYYAGQYVRYDGKVYRFTQTHNAGPWTGSDCVYTSIFNEFSNFVGTDTEKLHIYLSSSDGLLDVEGIEVNIAFADGGQETVTTDANGYAEVSIAKGRVYTVSVAQQGGQGYAFCPAQMGKATADDKYMYFEYSKIGGGYCVVKVYAYALGVRPEDASAWTGKQVQISLSDGTLQSEAFGANGVATFSYVPQNASGTIVCPKVAGYSTPRNLTILTGFTEQDIQANYGSLSAPGIYFTLADETDVDANALTPEDIPNVIALHIATETLINANSDFYVRPSDLWLTTNRPNYRWCEPNPNGQYPACPNVPAWNANTPYYDGKTASQNMFNDLQAQSTYSKVLDFAMAETLVTTHRTTYGFMPTRDQWQVLVDNYESVNGMIQMLDNTKSATYRQKSWWMATNVQGNTGYAWFWYYGGWNRDGKDRYNASWFCFFAI